jgi:hypothetical protein
MSYAASPGIADRLLVRLLPRESVLSDTFLLGCMALGRVAVQFLGAGRYGFFRDELYYIACSRHLAWGYIDQPPLIAAIAWLARHLFGDSLVGYRVLPILAGGATVFITGLLARELGGGRWAQILAAAVILFAPLSLALGGALTMNAFEPLIWLMCAWLAVRIVNGAPERLWLLCGAIAGVGLENKHTMLVFGFALVAGLLFTSARRPDQSSVFRSKWFWLSGLVALALFLPNLMWESAHGWPQIDVVRNAQQLKNVHISPLRFLAEQILFTQPCALPLWLAGLYWCLFARAGKRYRFLGWTYIIALGVFIASGGKTYYALPVYPLLAAAGGVAVEQFAASSRTRRVPLVYLAVLVLGGVITLPFGVPLLPVETFLRYSRAIPYARGVKTERDATAALPQFYADMFGWEHTAREVAAVYYSLSKAEQANCAILAGNYGEAGAIDLYGRKLGLPSAISGHNNYYLWGPREYSGSCVILFGERAEDYKNLFGQVARAATIVNPHAMPSEQSLNVYICRKPRASLEVLWPQFKLII